MIHITKTSTRVASGAQGPCLLAMETAAQLVAEADVLLLFTGAGFSADSGLATYDDVAKVGPLPWMTS